MDKDDFEVFCYESDEGMICLELGGAAISFSKKRFLEVADILNKIRQTVLENYLQAEKSKSETLSSYRI